MSISGFRRWVDAGGIGFQLSASIAELSWSKMALILLVIIATVLVSEWVSAKVRHSFIRAAAPVLGAGNMLPFGGDSRAMSGGRP